VRDIAVAVGVSQSTAARALSGRGYVSQHVRSLVVETADRLGYVPNNVARSLRANATGAIGVLISDLGNPFYAEVAKGIVQVLRSRGYRMLLADSDGIAEEEAAAIRVFQSMRVEGVIVTPAMPSSDLVGVLVRNGLAVVEVDRLTDDGLCDGVVVENEAGAYQATRHLLELGHRRIGLIVGETTYTTGARRLEGYVRAHADAGLPFDRALVTYTSFHPADAQAVARNLLREHEDVTALFATNNVLAQGALRAALAAGLKVPRDLSFVAFDDSDWMAFSSPAITTVAQPTQAIGREAATLMLDRLSGDLLGPAVVRSLPTRFIRRRSTGPARVRS
jgi:LacI family transcriptional regulator